MRGTLITLTTLLVSQLGFASGELLKVEDLHKKSEVLLKEASTAKTDTERAGKLETLKKEINSARDAYSKSAATEDSDANEEIGIFFYNLEPVFDLVAEKKIPAKCASTKIKIRSADSQGRPEGAPPTKNAAIALDWLKIFCKK